MSDLDSELKPSRRLWILAGVGALALHIGGAALAVAHLRPVDLDDSLGAPAIEIGLEMMSPHLEATDQPPGPDTDAFIVSPAIVAQKTEPKESDLPKDVLIEAENPDRAVTPDHSKEPKPDQPKLAAVQTSTSAESVPAVATATPSVDDAPVGRSRAPVQGVGKALQRMKSSWIARLSAHFDKHKRNPPLRKFRSARVVIDVTFDRLGHVVSSAIAVSSGDAAYDKAALATLRRSDPVPRPPPLVADEGLHFSLPVNFGAKGRS
jgi:periplasmic protein TonB